jgi:ABC-type multidrug transport system ATPase subunit
MHDIALSISGLTKSYGDFAVLRDLDLQIQRGAIHGLVGLNGSGKTTTLECILGLQGYQGGNISVLGHSPDKLHEARGNVVGIFDTPSLHPYLTVRQCMEHARILCDEPSRSPEEVENLLGITRFSDFKIRHLSLGNKRRASIAQALLGSPELIVLDEPFNGLDAGGVDDVLQIISNLNSQQDTSFLLSSHQLPYLEQICSHIAILHGGRVALSDETASLLGHSVSTVLVKTDQTRAATAVIEKLDGCVLLQTDASGYLHVALQKLESATLNQALIAQQIPVSELILERASLASLFRKITSEDP